MTFDIILVLVILGAAIALFSSERLRVDVTALLVLIALVLTRLITPDQALSGFSNPAVVTVWGVFILSGGLTATGVAHRLGAQIARIAGDSETRLIVVLMLVSGILSGFMNNIGVAAMLLPAVMGIARQRRIPPSRLLMPLAYAALLGGMVSLIGTPGNILITGILRDAGERPFGMFDYTPAGMVMLLVGIVFMVLFGRFLLPKHDAVQALAGQDDGVEQYPLHQRMALLQLPQNSLLAGRTLAECRIARALGLNILSIRRGGRHHFAPTPDMQLAGGDEILVLGRLDQFQEISENPALDLESDPPDFTRLLSDNVALADLTISADIPLAGHSVAQLDFRGRWGCVALALRRDGVLRRSKLADVVLVPGDELLLYGERAHIERLGEQVSIRQVGAGALAIYDLSERLLAIRIPKGSALAGRTLGEGRLGAVFGLVALAVEREGGSELLPPVEMALEVGDRLIVQGNPADLQVLRGLQELTVQQQPDIKMENLTAGPLTLVEATLSPYASLAAKSLQELNFRERYGMNVLAIWRLGRAYFSNLSDWRLQFGDAMLLFGQRAHIERLRNDRDIIVLEAGEDPDLKVEKAPVATAIMLGVVATAILGWLPLSIAAIIGATFMVILGCLSMDDAYRYIEWKAVFLIAGMLPLGIALEETGTAAFLAEQMFALLGDLGPLAVLAGLFTLTALLAQFMPNPVVAVLIAPVALNAAIVFGILPHAFLMAVALASSASFLTPVAHPANILVMGPGGYRFTDYIKTGFPLLLLLLAAAIFVIPLFWPFTAV